MNVAIVASLALIIALIGISWCCLCNPDLGARRGANAKDDKGDNGRTTRHPPGRTGHCYGKSQRDKEHKKRIGDAETRVAKARSAKDECKVQLSDLELERVKP